MDLQEFNSALQNSSAVPLIGNDGNCMQDQTFQVTANGTKGGTDLQGEGKVVSAPGHSDGHDPTFGSMVLPMCPSAHGILTPYLNIF